MRETLTPYVAASCPETGLVEHAAASENRQGTRRSPDAASVKPSPVAMPSVSFVAQVPA